MDRKTLRYTGRLVAILAIAAALRIWYSLYLPGHGRDLLHSDMAAYDESAWKMVEGLPVEGQPGFNGYHALSANTYNYPGYIYFVAAIYAIFGHSPLAVRAVQGVVGTATVWVVYVLGAVTFGRCPGLIAAALTAIYLPLVYYTGFLLSETWFLFLQLAALALWIKAWGPTASRDAPADTSKDPSLSELIGAEAYSGHANILVAGLAGIMAGAACITRAAFLPAVAAMAVLAWWSPPKSESRRRRTAMIAAFIIAASATVAPITWRNWQIHGRFILVTTNGPSTFYVGHVTHTAFIPNMTPGITDMAMAEEHRRLSWQYLRHGWAEYLAELPEFFSDMWLSGDFWPNATTYWRFEPAFDPRRPVRMRVVIDEVGGPPFGRLDYFPDLVRYCDRLVWLLVGLPLGLLALCFLPKDQRSWLVLYAALIPYLLIPLLAPGFARYRIPAVPLLFILAGQTICELIRCRRGSGSHQSEGGRGAGR